MSIQHQDSPTTTTLERHASPPPLFRVRLMNDDFTPMDFVIAVLQRFFAMDREKATRLMLQVHHEGSAVAGIYPRDIAETRSRQVTEYAQTHQHPLQCVIEIDR